jgi:glycosidase
MKKLAILSFLFFLVNIAVAQVITVEPPFPTVNDAVTVTLHTEGTGLEGYSGDVYAHTGLTVDGNPWQYVVGDWGNNETQPKLTKLDDNTYQLHITPSIIEYYGANGTDDVQQLCFVFRSADAAQQTSPDIFYDIYDNESLNIIITSPQRSPVIVLMGDIINVSWQVNIADSSFLYVNGIKVFADTGQSFQYELTVDSYGPNWVKAVAVKDDEMVADSFYFYTRKPVVIEEKPEGVVDGINYIDDSTVVLCLYAPMKNFVFAVGDWSDWMVNDDVYMKETPDSLRYWVEITGLIPDKDYVYQYFIDDSIWVGDIYADQVCDPWNDKYIEPSTYPDLPQYPDGKTEGIATVLRTGQQPFQWEVEDFDAPDPDNLVVYELLVRDFVEKHDFNTLIDTLDYLQRLGVNAIELMPVSEFEGNSSWGYNPNYYFAPDKYYGPKNTYKSFIDECHKRGIAVIMDMVLNHAYGTCPLVMMYFNSQTYEPAANNPWFNQTSPNSDYSWGYDFNHESLQTQSFVDSVNHYWIKEYHIDGFRFDFTKGFTNTPGDGWAYDPARIAVLKRMADQIWKYKQDEYVILEHFAENNEEKELADYGMILWGNSNYNYNEATMGYTDGGNSDFSWISYKKRGWSEPNLMGYMESHDEERLMYKNLTYGNSNGNYDITELGTALKRMELAGNFFFTIPGPKMIWEFGERGFDLSINWPCGDGNCRTDPKPPHWEYMDNWKRKKLYDVWKSLIELKENYDVFQTKDYTLDVAGAMKKIRLNSENMSVVILGNFGVVTGDITPDFYSTGTWYDYWTGDSIVVSNVSAVIELKPGEYRLYSNVKLDTPEFLAVNENKSSVAKLVIYPLPVRDVVNLMFNLNKSSTDVSVYIYDLSGKVIVSKAFGKILAGKNTLSLDLKELKQGVYLLELNTGKERFVSKVVIE